MTHQLNEVNRSHNQQHHQSGTEYLQEVGKQFILFQLQLQHMNLIKVELKQEVEVRN